MDEVIERDEVVGSAFREVLSRARLGASSDVPILVTGESGTGKEVVARHVHRYGGRRGPFVAVNATAVPSHLLESELFGHERGAFTGADRAREGLFLRAGGGTLLLDEIGDLSSMLQVKLLRVLQEGEVRPVGSDRTVPVDVRLVCATHRDLPAAVAEGTFRQDLYYRISVFAVDVPPLRERRDEVLPLARHFLRLHAERTPAPRDHDEPVEFSRDAAECLLEHDWPGNVRELENACRHALVLRRGHGPVLRDHLPPALSRPPAARAVALSLKAAHEQLERRTLLVALAATGGNRTRAARRLGLSRQSLHVRLKRLGIGPGAGRPGGAG